MSEEIQLLPTIEIGPDSVKVTRLALGMMGLAGTWDPNEVGKENIDQAVTAFGTAIESGINFFDHADVYGNGACEDIFEKCLMEVNPIGEKFL